jgi:hypothetical protein
MIWSLVLLACDPSMCVAMSGPITNSEDECHASFGENVDFIAWKYPQAQVVSYKCIPWGAPA